MHRQARPGRQRGMFLPALVVLLAVGGLGWLLSRQDSPASRNLAREMRTAQALGLAREALLGFASTYRNKEHPNADFGYLPCPDLDGDGSSETCGGQNQTSVGRRQEGQVRPVWRQWAGQGSVRRRFAVKDHSDG